MKICKTSRLFFNKFPYKVETKINGVNLIRSFPLDKLKDFLKFPADESIPRGYRRRFTQVDKQKLLEYINVVEPFLEKKIQTRVEHDTLNFYLDDKETYKEVKQTLNKWVWTVTEPESDDEVSKLQEKSGISIVKHLPYNKYRYKIMIRYTFPANNRLDFLNWLGNYDDKVNVSKSTKKWLDLQTTYFYEPFLYVEDKNTMLMVCMYLGKYARKIQEFVPRDTQITVK